MSSQPPSSSSLIDSFVVCKTPQEVTDIAKQLVVANNNNDIVIKNASTNQMNLIMITFRDVAKSAESVFWMIKFLLSILTTSASFHHALLTNPELLCSSLIGALSLLQEKNSNDGFFFWFGTLISTLWGDGEKKCQRNKKRRML